MTVTINQPQQIGLRSWLISWSSDRDNPVFYIYQDGKLVDTTTITQKVLSVDENESLDIEIIDGEADRAALRWNDDATLRWNGDQYWRWNGSYALFKIGTHPGRLTLHWYAATDTLYYKIEEYVDAVWTERAQVYDLEEGYFSWKTRFLEDSAVHQFRITPIGENNNEGTTKTFSCLMVRNPDEPDVDYAYSDDTKKVTISEV